MINSINSMNSAGMMRGNAMQHNGPPPGKDAFKVADSDGDGLVSSTELEAVVAGISEVTGNAIDAEATLATYDANQDGGLSGEEMLAMLQDNGFGPPQEAGEGPPPPPPPTEQALSSYAENSGDDMISKLISILQGSEDESGTGSPLDLLA